MIKTTCSECTSPIRLNPDTGEVSGNGLTLDMCIDDNDLLMWDCPWCRYADSYELD